MTRRCLNNSQHKCAAVSQNRCYKPNSHTQFRSVNFKTPFDRGVYDQLKRDGKLKTEPVFRCKVQRLLKTSEEAARKFRYDREPLNYRKHRKFLRQNGWVKLPCKVVGQGVAKLVNLYEQSTEIYGDHEGVNVENIVNVQSNSYRDVKGRNGRTDTVVVGMRRILESNKRAHRWVTGVVKPYLENLTAEHVRLLSETKEEDEDWARDQWVLRQPGRKKNRRVKILSAGVLSAHSKSVDQDFHSDPHTLTTEPTTLMALIALDRVTLLNGPTELISMTPEEIGPKNPGRYDNEQSVENFVQENKEYIHRLTLEKGQIGIFDPRLIHRGSANKTDRNRRLAYFIFGIGDMASQAAGGVENRYSYQEQVKNEGYFKGRVIFQDNILPSTGV